MTEYEKELVKEIKYETEAVRNYVMSLRSEELMPEKLQRLDRIRIICDIMLDKPPTEINPENKLV